MHAQKQSLEEVRKEHERADKGERGRLRRLGELRSSDTVGGRIHRVYDEPRTPYERLLASGQISRKVAAQLRATYDSLNPAALHRKPEWLRRELSELADATLPVVLRRRQRGPDITLGRRRAVRMA